jgi:hypothetical protein
MTEGRGSEWRTPLFSLANSFSIEENPYLKKED